MKWKLAAVFFEDGNPTPINSSTRVDARHAMNIMFFFWFLFRFLNFADLGCKRTRRLHASGAVCELYHR